MHIRQGDISIRRTAASLMMWGCQGLSLRRCRDKIVKSGPGFSFVCWRGFFFFCFAFHGQGSVGWIVPLSSFFYFLISEMWLPSSAFFRKYFKTNCFISMCRTEFRTASNQFYWHSLEKNVDESSRMWKDWNFKVPNTECRKISEVVSLSTEIYCVRICKRKICSRT